MIDWGKYLDDADRRKLETIDKLLAERDRAWRNFNSYVQERRALIDKARKRRDVKRRGASGAASRSKSKPQRKGEKHGEDSGARQRPRPRTTARAPRRKRQETVEDAGDEEAEG